MPSVSRVLTLFLCAVVAGCDPLAYVGAGQQLRPAPVGECLASALAKSPRVLNVTRRELRGRAPDFIVLLRDSLSSRGSVEADVSPASGPDSTLMVSVRVEWIGVLERYSDAERARWAKLGAELLGDPRAVCAPSSGDEVRCEQFERGRATPFTCSDAREGLS